MLSFSAARAATVVTRDVNDSGHVSVSEGPVRVHVNTTSLASDPLQSEISVAVGTTLVFDRKVNLATLSVSLANIAKADLPMVDVRLYSGGAHCCVSDLYIFPASGAADVGSFTRAWGNYPPTYVRVNGDLLLKGWIGTAYNFGNFAGSSGAIVLYALNRDGLRDVTRDYPEVLSRDAAQHLSNYNLEARGGPTGDASLACYLADEIRLGNAQAAWSRVRSLYGPSDFEEFANKVRDWLNAASIREP